MRENVEIAAWNFFLYELVEPGRRLKIALPPIVTKYEKLVGGRLAFPVPQCAQNLYKGVILSDFNEGPEKPEFRHQAFCFEGRRTLYSSQPVKLS